MKMREYARTMARYNQWMNEKLYDRCASLSEAERKQDRGAFFKSIHGTLNHLLLADRLWMGRFLGRPFQFKSLADELHAEFAALRKERETLDAEILAWAHALTEEQLEGSLSFDSPVTRRRHTFPCWHAVMQFFNHQTHHRGQVTALMSQCRCDPGVTDLLWLPGAEQSHHS